MTRLSTTLARNYVAHQRNLRQNVASQVAAIYDDDIDIEDIASSMDAVTEKVAPIVTAGKIQAAALAQALLQTQLGAANLPLLNDVRVGDVLDGMAAIGPMVLGQIGDGVALEEAIAFGSYLLDRFATNEVIKSADEETERLSRDVDQVIGWTGVVQPGACDNCQANEGDHDLDEEMWRHGNCGCERIPLLASE